MLNYGNLESSVDAPVGLRFPVHVMPKFSFYELNQEPVHQYEISTFHLNKEINQCYKTIPSITLPTHWNYYLYQYHTKLYHYP